MDLDHSYSAEEDLEISLLNKNYKKGTTYQTSFYLAKNLDYCHPGLESKIYLNHPLRVANLIVQNLLNIDDILLATALLHNIKEVSPNQYQDGMKSLPEEIKNAVEALTVDRSRQYERTYKIKYYLNIESYSPLASQVKVFDKIDNLFMICFNPDSEIRRSYLQEIEDFVLPLAKKYTNSNVINTLKLSVDEANSVGYLDKDLELIKARDARERKLL